MSCCNSTTSFFFFSSRRRHTRYIGDWSSDVCSSDLPALLAADAAHLEDVREVAGKCQRQRQMDLLRAVVGERDPFRSEERRVGKEWRFRWPPEHAKMRGV